MSEETQEQVTAVVEECPPAEPVAADECKKAVKFESNELTFDEAQAEIDAIKARAGEARENLRSAPVLAPITSSHGTYSSSTATSAYNLDDDAPKSKNMLSHLNSHSAMLNYKVQAARSLVRKQEDLLRNLARMRENMERSEHEIGKASDYYSPGRLQPRGYFERRAESAPMISRRHQVRDISPVLSTSNLSITEPLASESTYIRLPPSVYTHVSAIPTLPSAVISSSTYQPDDDFEREMAAIRKRVADLSKQANDVTTTKLSSYDYDSALPSTYLNAGYSDIYSVPEPKVEVKRNTSYKHAPRTHHHSYLPPKTAYTTKHVAVDNGCTSAYPRNSYTDYLMDSINDLDSYPCTSAHTAVGELTDLYSDPLASTVGDCPLAY